MFNRAGVAMMKEYLQTRPKQFPSIEYLEEFSRLATDPYGHRERYNFRYVNGQREFVDHRTNLVQKYAWAIPCHAALEAITKYGPIVEIGAGLGYWAMLLRQLAVDIVAYDKYPSARAAENHYSKDGAAWIEVLEGGPEKAHLHSDRALFLCWPPYDDPFARRCLENYRGNTLIYIGEQGGCTAAPDFDRQIDERWEEVEDVQIPQWDGIHDRLFVYRRRLGFYRVKRGKMSHGRRRRHLQRMRRPYWDR